MTAQDGACVVCVEHASDRDAVKPHRTLTQAAITAGADAEVLEAVT